MGNSVSISIKLVPGYNVLGALVDLFRITNSLFILIFVDASNVSNVFV